MTPQEERKEVAENLRKNADAHKGMPLLLNVAFAAFGDDTRDLMEETVTSQMAAHRLADLIDPVCRIVYVDDTYNTPETGRVDAWYYECSRCGGELDDSDMDAMDGGVKPFDYCPCCGARVVDWNA